MSFLPPSVVVTSPPVSPHRRRHRPARLSTDTTTSSISSLPAYSAPLRPPTHSNWPSEDTPTDQPPDYPQSAEEADTEDIDIKPLVSRLRLARSHQQPQQHQPTRRTRQHRRALSSLSIPPTSSLDNLLERSVVALELSTNALLQSINTTSTLSAATSDEHPPSATSKMLDRQPSLLKDSLPHNHHLHKPWGDDFKDILKRVDGLLLPTDNDDTPISRSLPTSTSLLPSRKCNQRRLYSNLTTASELDLTYSSSARAPRALTQYVCVESNLGTTIDATANSDSIFLSSTMGLRAASQIRQFTWNPTQIPQAPPIHKTSSIDSSSTSNSALDFLSNLASRHSSQSPSRRNGRRHSAGSADTSITITSNFRGVPLSTSTTRSSSSRTSTTTSFTEMPPPAPIPPPVRAMTPPTEESTPISSSSEEDQPLRVLQSLRKILDDSPDPKGKRAASPMPQPEKLKFMPRTPAVVPSSGTSMATASVYRLFTRNSHHTSSSTSRPKSSLKKKSSSAISTEPGTPTTPGDSRTPSRPSTPRQVTFAELPAEFPGRPRSSKTKNKSKKSKARSDEKEESRWLRWFAPSLGIGPSSGSTSGGGMAYEERIEDKMMRGWGRGVASTPGGMSGAEDWLV